MRSARSQNLMPAPPLAEKAPPQLAEAGVNSGLMQRVVSILDGAQRAVVRSLNSQMVIAYWLIGREIVQALQGGDGRAAYGQQLLESLSEQLGRRYGRGYSVTNLRNFRLFYQTFADRQPIHQTLSDELTQRHARRI